jgi:flagellar basal body rod protein FlgG
VVKAGFDRIPTMSRRFQFSLASLLCAVVVAATACALLRLAIDEEVTFAITHSSCDVAIDGDGFFQVIDPTTNRLLYTRTGILAVNSNGRLVIGSSESGRPVQPPVSLPLDAFDSAAVVISADGTIWIQQTGQATFSHVGQLQLAKFPNPQRLLKVEENLYRETPLSGVAIVGQPGADDFGTILQNQLERRRPWFAQFVLRWKGLAE